jgi:hypothetical protein
MKGIISFWNNISPLQIILICFFSGIVVFLIGFIRERYAKASIRLDRKIERSEKERTLIISGLNNLYNALPDGRKAVKQLINDLTALDKEYK